MTIQEVVKKLYEAGRHGLARELEPWVQTVADMEAELARLRAPPKSKPLPDQAADAAPEVAPPPKKKPLFGK